MPTVANANAATKAELRALTVGHGLIIVQGASATTAYECTADGVADDRATILEAMDAAVADMPAVVTFGPGDFGISGGIEIKPAHGARGLTIRGQGSTATRIRFNKGSSLVDGQYIAFAIKSSVAPTVGVYADYLHDVLVDGIGFYDDEPAVHGGGTANDESHCIKMQFVVNAAITNCHSDSIGDESFDFNYVVQGLMSGNTSVNTPSVGAASVLNVQYSQGVVIANNTLYGSATPGTISTVVGSSGIGIEIVTATQTDNVSDITISNNIIKDFEDAGIFPNNALAAAEMKHVTILGNIIDNCGDCIKMQGSNLHQYFTIIGNILTNTTNAINFDVPLVDNTDCVVSFNTIDTCSARGIVCNGSRLNLSGNNISNCASQAIYVSVGLDINISGGVIDSCGGTGIPVIAAAADGKEVTIDGVQILNSNSTTQTILSCERIRNCRIEGGTPTATMIFSANEVTNNRLNGGIGLDGTAYGSGIISGNRIHVGGADIGATCISLVAANDACIVTNNYINTYNGTTHRIGINIASTSDNHVICNNITVSDTAASGIVDAGTGTVLANNQELAGP